MPIETRAKDVVSGRAENEVGRGDSAGSCAPRERADGEQLEGDAARRLALSLGASTVGSLFRTSEEQPGSMESVGRCGSGSRFPVGLPGRQPPHRARPCGALASGAASASRARRCRSPGAARASRPRPPASHQAWVPRPGRPRAGPLCRHPSPALTPCRRLLITPVVIF